MNKYELAVVLSAKLEDEERAAAIEKVTGYITRFGGTLVEKAVQYARDRHKKITPLCSFAVSEFANNPSYKSVLAE